MLTSVGGCGGQTTSGTASTNAGVGGGSAVGGSAAGQGLTGGAAGSGGAGPGAGAAAGAPSGGTGGQSAAGGSAAEGGASGDGGSTGGSSLGGNGGAAGMCPDFQSGFAGGPAMPELAPEGPSCAGGLLCGGRSCCESIRVKGGLLHLGTDCSTTCDPDSVCPPPSQATPEIDIQIADFNLDTLPVTVGRFRKFVSAYTGTAPPDGAGQDPKLKLPSYALSGWKAAFDKFLLPNADALRASLKCAVQDQPGLATWTDAPGPNENKPINCVDWFHAFAFCIWDGGWLPIEATWEYAAAGGVEDRLYPWGQPPPDTTRIAYTCAYSGGPCDATLLPDVGSFPAGSGKWGHLDLSGYFDQWMQDAEHDYLMTPNTAPHHCNFAECFYPMKSPDIPDGMVLRAGYRSFDRAFLTADSIRGWIGMRCAR